MSDLRAIVKLWTTLISRARKDKEKKFGATARRAWDFVGKSYQDLYIEVSEDYQPFVHGGGPYFKARLNLSQQFLNIYLPHCHFRSPERIVTPSRPEFPPELFAAITGQMIPPGVPLPPSPTDVADTVRAWLLQWFLNYLPGEYNLRLEGAMAAQEALVKGRGVIWHELIDGPFGVIPGSFYDSVDGLLIDPEARTLRTAQYIIRERRANREALADAMRLMPDRLKGVGREIDLEGSLLDTEDTDRDRDLEADEDDTNVTYWEVYSRFGIGPRYALDDEELRKLRERFDTLADMPCRLVILPGVPFPLNLPPEVLEVGTAAEWQTRLEWPVPFHEDAANPWPMSALDFQPHTKDAWTKSPLEAALPLQVFLDQCYSFLMDRIAATSRQLVFVSQGLQEEVIRAIREGFDCSVIPVDSEGVYKTIQDMVHVLTFPDAHRDLYTLISMVQREFEKITGQDPLLYGSMGPTQARSSAEVQIRDARASTRPDDYAEKTAEWHSQIGRKEGIASRLYVRPEVIAPLVGERIGENGNGEIYGPITQKWAELVNTDDPVLACAELSYGIVAQSGQKKNKQKMSQDVQMIGQTLAAPLLQLYQTIGAAGPFNAFVRMIGEAYDLRTDDMMLPDMQQQIQQAQQQQQADPAAEAAAQLEQIRVQAEQAKAETERVKVAMEQVKIELERSKIDMERAKLETAEAKLETERAKTDTERAKTVTERARAKTAKAKPKQEKPR